MPFAILAVVALVGLVITYAIYSHKQNQQRIASLLSLAQSNGWHFSASDPFDLPRRWPGEPFDSGYDRHAQNVVTGEHQGHPLVAFDYSYKEDSQDSDGDRQTTTYTFQVVALGMPCALPEVHVGPEGAFARLGKMLGAQDIELESEDFNRTYRVRSANPKLATDVLTPRTMETLLSVGKVEFRLVGSDIVGYRSGALEPVDLLRYAHALSAVIDGVPSFVWRDHGLYERPNAPSSGSAS